MSTLLDIINTNPMLKRLYNVLEYGIETSELKLLLPRLNQFEIEGGALTIDHVISFRKQIVEDMLSHGCSLRDICGMKNIITVYGMAAISIQERSVPNGEFNKDFALKFYDYAKNCNDEDKQSLSIILFVKEMLWPNSFYLRTLDVFFKADKFEMDWFLEATKYIVDKTYVPKFILTDNRFYPFNKFQTLIDAGFMNASLGNISYTETATIKLSSAEMKLEIPTHPFVLSVYTLTDAGAQLFDLRPEPNADEYLDKLKETFEQNNRAKVTINKQGETKSERSTLSSESDKIG